MSTNTVTPNPNGNPFDVPLNSEIQESQQRQAATPAKASGYVNPFDEPLASEKAEQAAADARAAKTPEQDQSDTRQMLVAGMTGLPTPNMTDADKASFANGKAAGAISMPVVAAGAGVGAAAESAMGAIGAHLGTLKAIVNLAKEWGWAGDVGYKEARDLYKEFTSDKK